MASEDGRRKPILKSGDSSKASSRLTWDEDTITLHDLDRGTRMKIDEPKTPYLHNHSSADFLDAGVPYLELDTAIKAVDSDQHSTQQNGSSSQPSSNSQSASDDQLHEWDDSEDEGLPADILERKRHFAQMRAQHYNMKDALAKVRWEKAHRDHKNNHMGLVDGHSQQQTTDHPNSYDEDEEDDDDSNGGRSSYSDKGSIHEWDESSTQNNILQFDATRTDNNEDEDNDLGDRRGGSPNGRKRQKG